MSKNNQTIRISLEKEVKTLGKSKIKVLNEAIFDTPEDLKVENLELIKDFVYELLNNKVEKNEQIFESVFGPCGKIVVEDSTNKYFHLRLTKNNVENFAEFKSALEGRFDKPIIKQILLPSNIVEIPEKTFADLSGLEMVYFNEGLKVIGAGAFSGCFRLGESEEVVLPESLQVIGRKAFAGTTGMKQDLILGSNVVRLDEGAFMGSGLFGISLKGTEVDVVSKMCFKNAKNLTAVLLGDATEMIEDSAFEGARNLEEINLEHVTTLGDRAFFCDRTSKIQEFNLQSLIYAGKDCFGDVKNSRIILSDNLDANMARNAGLPAITIVQKPKVVSNFEILGEKQKQREAVKNVVEEVEVEDLQDASVTAPEQDNENHEIETVDKIEPFVEDGSGIMIGKPNREGKIDFQPVKIEDDVKTRKTETRKTETRKENKKDEIERIGGY